MSDRMRSEFEEWAVSEGMPITRGHYYDVYASAETRAAYLAWQAARTVPEGFVMVPKTIHPFDRPDCDAVVQLLATPPDAGRIDNPQDYYQYWWELLLSAAPEGKK